MWEGRFMAVGLRAQTEVATYKEGWYLYRGEMACRAFC
jgi:hypothetical protein